MARQRKAQPDLAPEGEPLQDVLKRAVGDEAARRGITVTLRVSGGAPSEEYAFDFRASGDGTAGAEMRSALTKRRGKAEAARLTDQDFTALLRRLVASRVLETPEAPPRFLPDTLVGRLEISDGRSVSRRYFAADPEQAKVQETPPVPEMARAVDAIYALSGKLMGMSPRRVKP
jgi:hypothetical protein